MQTRKTVVKVTVLALAIAGILVACQSTTQQANTAEVKDTAKVEEVVVTGARIVVSRGDAPTAVAAQSAPAAPLMEMRRQAAIASVQQPYAAPVTEHYATLTDNAIKSVMNEPVSTFSIDVDTGSYSNVRRFISGGHLPPADAVRTEELVNYFAYDYPKAAAGTPFSINTEMAASPWHEGRHLLQVGIRAVDPAATTKLHSNLVFLVDVSGSMNSPDKLGLVKSSLNLLTHQLDAQDTVAIVVYAGASGVVLEPTAGDHSATILQALERLQAGGGTNGEAGIQLAYSLAEQHYIKGGINRVLLATDGDFNVGTTNFDDLKKLIEQKRKTGISLTTLGFGTGNYNDQLMEQLADAGNGNYAYIDNVNEARKVLVDELASTLQTVAKDVKIQIEFNPALVSEYRLIGYENRVLNKEDFNNDKVDAGEIGAGHGVTALYELTLVGSSSQSVDPLRYSAVASKMAAPHVSELAYLKLRYKEPDGDVSRLIQRPLKIEDIRSDSNKASSNYQFAAAVAGFGQLLRDNKALGKFGYDDVLKLAQAAKGDDEFGYRSEFIGMVRTAKALANH